MTEKNLKKLPFFHNTWLRKIIRVFCPRKTTSEDMHKALQYTYIEIILLRRDGDGLVMFFAIHDDIAKVALKWAAEGKIKGGHHEAMWDERRKTRNLEKRD